MTDTRLIASFATRYHAYMTADSESSRRVWQDLYVISADELGLLDSDHVPLRDARAEKKRRDDDAFASYCARHPAMGDQ